MRGSFEIIFGISQAATAANMLLYCERGEDIIIPWRIYTFEVSPILLVLGVWDHPLNMKTIFAVLILGQLIQLCALSILKAVVWDLRPSFRPSVCDFWV